MTLSQKFHTTDIDSLTFISIEGLKSTQKSVSIQGNN